MDELLKGTSPEPWQVGRSFEYGRWQIVGPMEGYPDREAEVAMVNGDQTARLIAAAPDLARELLEARELIRDLSGAVNRLLDCDLDRVCSNDDRLDPKYEHGPEVEAALKRAEAMLRGEG